MGNSHIRDGWVSGGGTILCTLRDSPGSGNFRGIVRVSNGMKSSSSNWLYRSPALRLVVPAASTTSLASLSFTVPFVPVLFRDNTQSKATPSSLQWPFMSFLPIFSSSFSCSALNLVRQSLRSAASLDQYSAGNSERLKVCQVEVTAARNTRLT